MNKCTLTTWQLADFHLHTPLSDHQANRYYKKGQSIGYVLSKFNNVLENSKVQLFAITDYYTIEKFLVFVDTFFKQHTNSEKVFFPNLEFRINTSLNSILQKNIKNYEAINAHLLILLPITKKNYNNPNTIKLLKDLSALITTTLNNVSNKQAITIDAFKSLKAHIQNRHATTVLSGFELDGYGRFPIIELNKRLNIFKQHIAEDIKNLKEQCDFLYINYNENIRRELNRIGLTHTALIKGTDAHSFQEFKIREKKYSQWVKSDITSPLGLYYIFEEHSTRIRFDENNPFERKIPPYILNVTYNLNQGKNVKARKMIFSPWLNVVIGYRGTGKTTLLNTIDFLLKGGKVLESDDLKEIVNKYNISSIQGEVKNQQEDASIPLVFITEELPNTNDSYAKEQYYHYYLKQGELASIYLGIDNQIEQFFNIFNPPDFSYTVNDKTELFGSFLQEYREIKYLLENILNRDLQSTLQNEYENAKHNLTQKISHLKQKLNYILSEDIRKLSNKIEELRTQKKELYAWREKAKEIQESLNEGVESLQTITESLFENKNETISQDLENAQSVFQKIINSIDSEITNKLQDSKKQIAELNTKLKELLEKNQKTRDINPAQIQKAIEETNFNIRSLKEKEEQLDNLFEKIKNDYNEIRTWTMDAWLSRLDIIKNHIFEINKTLQNNIRSYKVQYHIDLSIVPEAKILTDQITEAFSSMIYKSSEHKVIRSRENLENSLKDLKILLTNYILDNGKAVERLRIGLKSLFDTLLKKIFFEINQEDIKKQSQRNIEDYFDFMVNVIPKFITYKYSISWGNENLENLSGGTKAGILLLIRLLLSAEDKSIVLLDQPENDLDQKFITEILIPLLKKLSKYKQIIIVTHNANLAVHSDPDQLIVMKDVNDFICGPLESETIQKAIIDVLEGGETALKSRLKKYNNLSFR